MLLDQEEKLPQLEMISTKMKLTVQLDIVLNSHQVRQVALMDII